MNGMGMVGCCGMGALGAEPWELTGGAACGPGCGPVGCCGMGALKKPGRKKRAGEKSRKTMKKPAPAIDPKLLLGGGLAVAALVLLLRK